MFADATMLPKMHILEDHVVPWMKEWGVGFGLMGEQGAESIHTYFNQLGRIYNSIPNPVQRLKYTMKEHLLHVAPKNIASRPPIKKRSTLLNEHLIIIFPIFNLFFMMYHTNVAFPPTMCDCVTDLLEISMHPAPFLIHDSPYM